MDTTWWGLPAAAIIVGVVELFKRAGLNHRWAGILAVILGIVGGCVAHVWADSELAAAVAQGLVAGLAAAGLWSTAKNAAGR